jgi:hypothetical protein
MKKIYRGIWADKLENGDELPIGGSMFSEDLTIKLQLNFNDFNEQLENYHSPYKVSEVYTQKGKNIIDWLAKIESKVDPYLFFVANTVQGKVQALMDIKKEKIVSDLERKAKFKDDKAKLTDLKGIAMCAEQASLGSYLLQNILENGYSSSYMSGVETLSPDGELNNHSFIVLKNQELKTYIFDIARPRSKDNLPRILETDVPFNYELFNSTKNLLVGATEVLEGGKMYFGVGHPMLEQKPIIA